jgi:hypothetical protein
MMLLNMIVNSWLPKPRVRLFSREIVSQRHPEMQREKLKSFVGHPLCLSAKSRSGPASIQFRRRIKWTRLFLSRYAS